MTDDFKISMHRLNLTHNVDDEVCMAFFPPNKNYYSELLQNERFKLFLMSDGTTKEGQDSEKICLSRGSIKYARAEGVSAGDLE